MSWRIPAAIPLFTLLACGPAFAAGSADEPVSGIVVTSILIIAGLLVIAGVSSTLSAKAAYRRAARALSMLLDGEEHDMPAPGHRELNHAMTAVRERLESPQPPPAAAPPEPPREVPDIKGHEELLRRVIRQEDELRRGKVLLEQLNSELIAANQSRAEFIERMGREVTVPLNTLIGLADILGRGTLGPLNDKQSEYVGRMSERAFDIIGVVNEFTELSQLDDGVSVEYTDVDLQHLCGRVTESLGPMARSKDVELILEVGDLTIRADYSRLRFIINDLIHNAIKFNRRGGTVRVFAYETVMEERSDAAGAVCDSVEIVVADTGIGIAETDLPMLYKPFTQFPDEYGLKPRGVGLSLYLVKKFIELHGGTIHVESKRGQGSTFRVTLPSHDSCAGPEAREDQPKRVLIVEDDPAQLELVKKCLASEPFEIHGVSDGVEALRAVGDLRPDLILLDIMMPKLDGISVCKTLKRNKRFGYMRHVPIVMMTSSDEPEMRLEGAKVGADEFLKKPLDIRLLKERVRSLLIDKEHYDSMVESYRTKEREASVDPLTGLYNRRTMQRMLDAMLAEEAAADIGVSALMLDLDHFKQFNDTHGHPAGDELLKSVANVFRLEVREVDIVSRYGGEEFLIILPGTPSEMASTVAERIRASVKARTGRTISIGIACYPANAETPMELISNADKALYLAKEGGRDRVVMFEGGPDVHLD